MLEALCALVLLCMLAKDSLVLRWWREVETHEHWGSLCHHILVEEVRNSRSCGHFSLTLQVVIAGVLQDLDPAR